MIDKELIGLEAAHMTCRAAWIDPDNDRNRAAAICACELIGIDYITTLADIIISTAASPETARRLVAEGLRKKADRRYETLHLSAQ